MDFGLGRTSGEEPKMATPAKMKLLEEKQVDRAITQLLWSPKMDILAVVSENNDASLFRLNWQKVFLI